MKFQWRDVPAGRLLPVNCDGLSEYIVFAGSKLISDIGAKDNKW
jgi:hypothetical protein